MIFLTILSALLTGLAVSAQSDESDEALARIAERTERRGDIFLWLPEGVAHARTPCGIYLDTFRNAGASNFSSISRPMIDDCVKSIDREYPFASDHLPLARGRISAGELYKLLNTKLAQTQGFYPQRLASDVRGELTFRDGDPIDKMKVPSDSAPRGYSDDDLSRAIIPSDRVFLSVADTLRLVPGPRCEVVLKYYSDAVQESDVTEQELIDCFREMLDGYIFAWDNLSSQYKREIPSHPNRYYRRPTRTDGLAKAIRIAFWNGYPRDQASIVTGRRRWIRGFNPRLPWLPLPSATLWFWLTLAILWWAGLTALRLAWCIPARRFGFYNPEHFRFWSYLWPWRPIFRPLLPFFTWLREFRHGKMATAKWTPLLESLTLMYRPGLILLGRLRWLGLPLFQPVGIEGSGRHLAMIAAPGSGKTTMLMSMLALHRGTCFVVDCDGQMINAVGRRLGSGGRGIFGKGNDVRLLDPYGASKSFPGSSWNAIWELRRFVEEHGRDSAVGFAQTMAEALIKGGEGQNAWVQKDARAFLKGLILYVSFYEPPGNQNLVRLRQLLAQGVEIQDEDEDGFRSLLLRMRRINDFGGAISNAAGVMESSLGSDNKSHPRSDALEQTQ